MSFRDELKKSFGITDRIFGGHPSESEHARKMLEEASKKSMDKTAIEKAVRDFLSSEGYPSDHIEDQIKRINDIENYI